jgi:hypothetical protein
MKVMFEENYLDSVRKQFNQYKTLGEKAIAQIPEDRLNWQYNPETNSIVAIVKHLSGNMLSRFTDFFSTDGEKKWRNRDAEFENEIPSKQALMNRWNEGWNCFFSVLNALTPGQLSNIVLIRNEEHTVMEAINRQLTHYSYHIGQIIFLGKMICDRDWESLSIPKNKSAAFNAEKGL